jgi:hypothetical protein
MSKQALLPLNPFPDTMLRDELDVLVDAASLIDAQADVLIKDTSRFVGPGRACPRRPRIDRRN